MLTPYYKDDSVTIYNTECQNLMHELEGTVVTDPPYNIGYHYDGYADNLNKDDYLALLKIACRKPSIIIHYIEDLFDVSRVLDELPSRVVAWVYPSNTARQWRGIAWFGITPDFRKCGQDYRNPTDKRIAERIERGEKARLYDWWEVNQIKNVGKEKTSHPCQIPLEVMRRVLSITDSETFIDPFAGSGTTGRAAKDLGRKAILIERNEQYCEIAAKRLSQEVLPLC